jgi:hypothetical protein
MISKCTVIKTATFGTKNQTISYQVLYPADPVFEL